MSEETQNQEALNEIVAELSLEDRLVASYIGKDFTIANYKGEDVVFLRGERGSKFIDIVMTVAGATEMVEEVQKIIKNAKHPEELDSVEPTE